MIDTTLIASMSKMGRIEFRTEIELLLRVHHKYPVGACWLLPGTRRVEAVIRVHGHVKKFG